jgi:histidinol-phosphate aminotransferase
MSIWNLANQNLRLLVPYEPGKPVEDVARELGLDPASIIKLASNENPLGPSPKAQAAMTAAIRQAHIYPDGGAFHLRNAVAARFGVDRSQVIIGNGSNEIIELAYHAFTTPGKSEVIASRYAFVVYKLMAQLFGIDFTEVPDKAFAHDLDAIRAAVTERTKVIFITSPNNPTGTRIPNEALKRFIEQVPSRVIIVLDEAYYEFLDNPPPSVSWIKDHPNLIVCRTFSKIQGLAGLRIGYGLTSTETAEILQRCRQPFNINSLALAGALAGLADGEHIAKTQAITREGLARLGKFFDTLGLKWIPSEANFLMVNVKDADGVFKALLQKGVIVRSLKSYHLPEWIRVSIGTPAEMERFENEFLSIWKKA